jgi:hypothetical protein
VFPSSFQGNWKSFQNNLWKLSTLENGNFLSKTALRQAFPSFQGWKLFKEFPGVGNFLFPKGFHQKWEGKLLTRVQNEPMPEMQSDG